MGAFLIGRADPQASVASLSNAGMGTYVPFHIVNLFCEGVFTMAF